MPNIEYRVDEKISVEQFIDLLNRSTLAARRPLESAERVQRMLDHANLIVTAWDGDKLVGVSRSVTDFSFCCYLSDLAVDESYQRSGIGKELIRRARRGGAGMYTSPAFRACRDGVLSEGRI